MIHKGIEYVFERALGAIVGLFWFTFRTMLTDLPRYLSFVERNTQQKAGHDD